MIDPWCVCHSFLASRNSLPTVCYSSLVEMSCLPPVSFSGLPTELIFYCFLLLSHLPHHSPPAFSFWGSVSCGTLKGQWKHAPAGAVLYHDLSPLGVLRTNNKAKQKDTCWWFVTQLAQISLISCLCCSLSFLVSTPPPPFFFLLQSAPISTFLFLCATIIRSIIFSDWTAYSLTLASHSKFTLFLFSVFLFILFYCFFKFLNLF